MGEYENIKHILESTGLYQLTEGNFIDAEIKAYAAALDIYFEALQNMYRELMISTAESYGLEFYEKNMNLYSLDDTLSGRRETISKILSVSNSDFTENQLKKIFEKFHIHGTLSYNGADKTYTFTYTDTITQKQKNLLENQMARFIPAWCNFSLVSQ